MQVNEYGENSIPLDEGNGKVLDIDPTNVVKPGDLPNSNGNSNNGNTTNPTNNGNPSSTTSATTNNNGTKPTTGSESGTKPNTNTTTNSTGTKPTTTSPATNSGATKPSGTTVKPKPEPTGGITTIPTTPSTTAAIAHTVKVGETLYALSKLYNVSVDQIKVMNGLKDNNIKPGQVLTIKK